jgi:4a-hydroxytetrahydrobiopterin dehydratase
MNDLLQRRCSSNPELTPRLSDQECHDLMNFLHDDWQLDLPSQTISRTFEFKNYYQTMAFANSVAWIAHRQDHHPNLTISYRHCAISYSTHSVSGLSINDFICATHIDASMVQE